MSSETKASMKIFRTAEWSLWAAHALSALIHVLGHLEDDEKVASWAADYADALAEEKARRDKEDGSQASE